MSKCLIQKLGNAYNRAKNRRKYAVRQVAQFLWVLCLGLGYASGLRAEETIVIIDMPYELLASLGEYEEIHNQEKQQDQVLDPRMIPVLRSILHEYRQQQDNLEQLAQNFADPEPLRLRQQKMARFIALFQEELNYRQTMQEFREAMEKQQHLLDSSGKP